MWQLLGFGTRQENSVAETKPLVNENDSTSLSKLSDIAARQKEITKLIEQAKIQSDELLSLTDGSAVSEKPIVLDTLQVEIVEIIKKTITSLHEKGTDKKTILDEIDKLLPLSFPVRDEMKKKLCDRVQQLKFMKLSDYIQKDDLEGVERMVAKEKVDNSLLNSVKSLKVLLVLLGNGYDIEVMEDFLYNILPEKGCFEIISFLSEKKFLFEKKSLTERDVYGMFYSLLLWEKAYDESYFNDHLDFLLNIYKKISGKDKLPIKEILQESYIGAFVAKHGL